MLPPLKQGEPGNNCLSGSCCKWSYFCNPLNDFVLDDLYSELTGFERLELIEIMEETKRVAEWKIVVVYFWVPSSLTEIGSGGSSSIGSAGQEHLRFYAAETWKKYYILLFL